LRAWTKGSNGAFKKTILGQNIPSSPCLDMGNRKDYLKRSSKIEETIGFEVFEV